MYQKSIIMDVRDYKDNANYQSSSQVGAIMAKLDLDNPGQEVLEPQASMPLLLQNYVACQAATNAELISFMGQRITTPITIGGNEQTVAQQQQALSTIANKQNLLTRQVEKSLSDHLKMQKGIDCETREILINEPPMGSNFGLEAKVSDTGLRLITPFTGDSLDSNESDLTIFLREIFSLSQTNNLTENAAISVIIRKVAGSAQILLDDFVARQGGPTAVTLRQLVGHLEKKFIVRSSPLHADAQLHTLQQGKQTYSQLQARVQRLVRLACRLESEEKKQTLIIVKENASFMMAISPEDRLNINSENARRASDNLPALTLDQMCNHLSKNLADKMNYEMPAYTVQEPPVEENETWDSPVNYVQRGSFRGRNKTRGTFGQPPRGNYNQRGNVRNGRFQRNRGNYGSRNKTEKRPLFITAEMANVPKGCCLFCGDPGHTFKDTRCIYAGSDLMPSPCKRCFKGVHATATCKNKIGGQTWPAHR